MSRICVCVFAKAPTPGSAKTRLAATLGAKHAAELARRFFEDTWAALRELPWVEPILATTDANWCRAFVEPHQLWLQGDGDLGERLERVLGRALGRRSRAIAIGADTPGLPGWLLECAHIVLRDNDAVLGPSNDGGFYLLGLRACPTGVLHDLPWSTSQTFAETRLRLRRTGLSTLTLAPWFDVDDGDGLSRLAELLSSGQVVAPATAGWLREQGFFDVRSLPTRSTRVRVEPGQELGGRSERVRRL